MSRHTGIELTDADVPPERREAWREAKADRQEMKAIKDDLQKWEIDVPAGMMFDLPKLREYHKNIENTPQWRYKLIRDRYLARKRKE